MDASFTGGCACGSIRYECTGEPVMAFNCHCRDCQRASGTAYAFGLVFPADAVRLTRGELRFHAATADSGNAVSRGFCAECGSPVLATQAAFPVRIVYAASLDDSRGVRPAMDVFTSSAQPWDHMDAGLPKFPRGLIG